MPSALKTLTLRLRNIALYGSYIPTEFFVLDQKRLVYISIPKVACTSIKTALFEQSSSLNTGRESYMDIHKDSATFCTHSLSTEQRKYYKFAFVRNPLERLISCYKDKVARPVQHTGKYYFDSAFNNKMIWTLFGDKFRPDMSFDEFVALVARIPDLLADGHFRSQYSILAPHGHLSVDYVGKFEQLEQDWAPLAQKHNLPPLSEHNPTKPSEWREYFHDQSTLELAEKRYQRDLDDFGYRADFNKVRIALAAPSPASKW